ncbi:protein FAM200A-like [Cylas formicarius]|uniref:protein FAM200A-like n=1 Tax=Cylas formicarius TaxID=197179 RepID=UPI002958BD58|nr:protein FAM200A-like [Cylas formicarius]
MLSKKPIEYFERLLQTSNKEKNTLEKYVTLNDKYPLASYEVSYLLAKTKKPFTIGEQLLLPAAIRMSEIVHGKQYAAEMSKIPLSNDTVSKRISDISNDQFQQLLMRLKDSSKFAIQLDESTDISKMAQLLLFNLGLEGSLKDKEFRDKFEQPEKQKELARLSYYLDSHRHEMLELKHYNLDRDQSSCAKKTADYVFNNIQM